MTKLFLLSLCAGPLLLAAVARADTPSLAPPSVAMMAHIEIYERETKQTVDHAVFITSDSNEGGGEMEVEGPRSSTKIRVRLTTHGPQQSVWFGSRIRPTPTVRTMSRAASWSRRRPASGCWSRTFRSRAARSMCCYR